MFKFIFIYVILAIHSQIFAKQIITAVPTNEILKIDGLANEKAWSKIPFITSYDKTAKIKLQLKALYNNTHIFFLVQFPDKNESRSHKLWTWNKKEKIYLLGPEREDTFVFKWNLEGKDVDLSLKRGIPHKADIWFWKSVRTDPSNFADDKYQILSSAEPQQDSYKIKYKDKTMYLLRKSDSGTSAYKSRLMTNYKGDKLQNFTNIKATGSRADIVAKGHWKNGIWSIEFKRKLNTKHDDDIQFIDLDKLYLFGISRHEIAGRPKDPSLDEPLFGSGDVSEKLYLKFKRKK